MWSKMAKLNETSMHSIHGHTTGDDFFGEDLTGEDLRGVFDGTSFHVVISLPSSPTEWIFIIFGAEVILTY